MSWNFAAIYWNYGFYVTWKILHLTDFSLSWGYALKMIAISFIGMKTEVWNTWELTLKNWKKTPNVRSAKFIRSTSKTEVWLIFHADFVISWFIISSRFFLRKLV